jgi:hypothetical protein
MKTFNEFITEKWVSDTRKRNTSFPIYENPSSKDLIELRKAGLENDLVRFIALSSTKKIYVFSGMNILHDDAYNQLTHKKVISRVDISNLDNALCGECKLTDGRLTFSQNTGIDSYFGGIVSNLRKNNRDNIDSFLLEPYTDIKEFISDIPMIMKKYQWVSKFIDEYETKSSPAIVLQLYKK